MEKKLNVLKNEKFLEKVYEDALQPSAKRVGKAGEDLLKFVALPFTFLGLTAEQLEERYKKFINESINKVPTEKRGKVQAAIASPLLDHIKYLFDDTDADNLIKMFSDLLANSVNEDMKNSVHVSYIHTLRQLGNIEAEILKQIYMATDDYDILGVAFRRNCEIKQAYIDVLSDEAEPLHEEEENVFFYYNLIILNDDIPISNTAFSEALNILIHHNLVSSFKVNKYKDTDKYTLEKHDKSNLNKIDPYATVRGYCLTKYGEDFMFACIDPKENRRAEFSCMKCGEVFRNIHENGICLRCGSRDVKLI